MSELYLIRHGQASFGADNYDQLSDLGYQQSRWLGEYFRERDIQFDRVITGDMARQRQTAESIFESLGQNLDIDTHTGFNEFDFHALVVAYTEQHPERSVSDWKDHRKVYAILREAMGAWSRNEIHTSLPETWQSFQERVKDALSHARQTNSKQRVLVASSGGAISMALSQIMGFDSETLINLNLQSKNTGITHFYFNQDSIYTTSFNHVPHLDRPDRLDAITHS